MALVVADQGEPYLLNWMLASNNTSLRLFKSNTTPSGTTVFADLTEADFDGYAEITLTAGSWNNATEVSNKAVKTYADQTFTSSDVDPQVVYGYYVTFDDSGTDKLLWAEKFSSSRTINNTETITVQPRITLTSE